MNKLASICVWLKIGSVFGSWAVRQGKTYLEGTFIDVWIEFIGTIEINKKNKIIGLFSSYKIINIFV